MGALAWHTIIMLKLDLVGPNLNGQKHNEWICTRSGLEHCATAVGYKKADFDVTERNTMNIAGPNLSVAAGRPFTVSVCSRLLVGCSFIWLKLPGIKAPSLCGRDLLVSLPAALSRYTEGQNNAEMSVCQIKVQNVSSCISMHHTTAFATKLYR